MIPILENPTLEEVKRAIQAVTNNRLGFVCCFFANQQEAENRPYGHTTARNLGYKHKVLLLDLNLEQNNSEILINTLSGFIALNEKIEYLGHEERKERIFERYLYANLNLDILQRQFARQGVMRSPNKMSIVGLPTALQNIPCSLIDFDVPRALFEEMRSITATQARLWNSISNDPEYQLSCIEKYPNPP